MKTYKNAAEAKLASLAWKLKLIQTSVQVTHTTGTTLKSLLLGVVKKDGPVYVEKLGKTLAAIDSALDNPEPLMKSDHDTLRSRIY